MDPLLVMLGWPERRLRDQLGLSYIAAVQESVELSATEVEAGLWTGLVTNHTPSGYQDTLSAATCRLSQPDMIPGQHMVEKCILLISCCRMVLLKEKVWEPIRSIPIRSLTKMIVFRDTKDLLLLRIQNSGDVLLEVQATFRRQLMHHLLWATACDRNLIDPITVKQSDSWWGLFGKSTPPPSEEGVGPPTQRVVMGGPWAAAAVATNSLHSKHAQEVLARHEGSVHIEEDIAFEKEHIKGEEFDCYTIPSVCTSLRTICLTDEQQDSVATLLVLHWDVFCLLQYQLPSPLVLNYTPMHTGFLRVRVPPEALRARSLSRMNSRSYRTPWTAVSYSNPIDDGCYELGATNGWTPPDRIKGPHWRQAFAVLSGDGMFCLHVSPRHSQVLWEKNLADLSVQPSVYCAIIAITGLPPSLLDESGPPSNNLFALLVPARKVRNAPRGTPMIPPQLLEFWAPTQLARDQWVYETCNWQEARRRAKPRTNLGPPKPSLPMPHLVNH
eukprot:Platyproteum_vivax@DN156_c0_g1_i1.p1